MVLHARRLVEEDERGQETLDNQGGRRDLWPFPVEILRIGAKKYSSIGDHREKSQNYDCRYRRICKRA